MKLMWKWTVLHIHETSLLKEGGGRVADISNFRKEYLNLVGETKDNTV